MNGEKCKIWGLRIDQSPIQGSFGLNNIFNFVDHQPHQLRLFLSCFFSIPSPSLPHCSSSSSSPSFPPLRRLNVSALVVLTPLAVVPSAFRWVPFRHLGLEWAFMECTGRGGGVKLAESHFCHPQNNYRRRNQFCHRQMARTYL